MKARENHIVVESVHLLVPGIPPSGNHYVKHTRQGRHYVTAEAIRFQNDIAIVAGGKKMPDDVKLYAVRIRVVLGPKQRGDVDNFCKVTLDGLVKARVIKSDSSIVLLTVAKTRGPKSETEIVVGAVF